jgi:hypothetical protein
MVLLSAVIGTLNCSPHDVHTATAGVLLSHFVTLIALFGIVIIRHSRTGHPKTLFKSRGLRKTFRANSGWKCISTNSVLSSGLATHFHFSMAATAALARTGVTTNYLCRCDAPLIRIKARGADRGACQMTIGETEIRIGRCAKGVRSLSR